MILISTLELPRGPTGDGAAAAPPPAPSRVQWGVGGGGLIVYKGTCCIFSTEGATLAPRQKGAERLLASGKKNGPQTGRPFKPGGVESHLYGGTDRRTDSHTHTHTHQVHTRQDGKQTQCVGQCVCMFLTDRQTLVLSSLVS